MAAEEERKRRQAQEKAAEEAWKESLEKIKFNITAIAVVVGIGWIIWYLTNDLGGPREQHATPHYQETARSNAPTDATKYQPALRPRFINKTTNDVIYTVATRGGEFKLLLVKTKTSDEEFIILDLSEFKATLNNEVVDVLGNCFYWPISVVRQVDKDLLILEGAGTGSGDYGGRVVVLSIYDGGAYNKLEYDEALSDKAIFDEEYTHYVSAIEEHGDQVWIYIRNKLQNLGILFVDSDKLYARRNAN